MTFLAQVLLQLPTDLPTLTTSEMVGVAVLAVFLLIGLVFLKAVFKLTQTLLKMGCMAVVFIVGAALVLAFLL